MSPTFCSYVPLEQGSLHATLTRCLNISLFEFSACDAQLSPSTVREHDGRFSPNTSCYDERRETTKSKRRYNHSRANGEHPVTAEEVGNTLLKFYGKTSLPSTYSIVKIETRRITQQGNVDLEGRKHTHLEASMRMGDQAFDVSQEHSVQAVGCAV